MRLVFTVLLPCFILDKVLGAEVLKDGRVIVSSFALGFSLILTSIALAAGVGKLIGLGNGTGIRTFAITAGSQNYGFTAAPVIEILWGAGALAVLFVHNIGVELALWSAGAMIMSGERGLNWRKLVNGPVVAVVLGMLLIVLGIDDKMTGPGRTAMSMLGSGAFPVAIFITGCMIMDLVASERPTWKILGGSAVVRVLLCPALFLTAAKFLPLAVELRQVLVVQAAMPAAMTPILLARLFGGRPGIAVQIVVATTALSLVTLPWIIALGCGWIGLKPLTVSP